MDHMEIVVSKRGEPTKFSVVPFEGLSSSIPDIRTLTFLWDCNCYHVNAEDRTFIVNGGRKLKLEGIEGWEDVRVIYRRRTRVEMGVGDGRVAATLVTWLLGLEGTVGGARAMRLVHVGPGGRQWCWRDDL